MVVDAIHVASGAPGFGKDDIRVEWDPTETRVGLLIRGQLWAAFDSVARVRYGGDYNPNGQPEIPTKIMQSFW